MSKLVDVVKALRYVHIIREQVNLVSLSKVPLTIRRIFYVVDSLIFSVPFIMVGIVARSWPMILILGGVTAVLSFSYWHRVESNIPAVIETIKVMRGGTSDS